MSCYLLLPNACLGGPTISKAGAARLHDCLQALEKQSSEADTPFRHYVPLCKMASCSHDASSLGSISLDIYPCEKNHLDVVVVALGRLTVQVPSSPTKE